MKHYRIITINSNSQHTQRWSTLVLTLGALSAIIIGMILIAPIIIGVLLFVGGTSILIYIFNHSHHSGNISQD